MKPKPTKAQKRHKLAVKIAKKVVPIWSNSDGTIQAIEKLLEMEGV